ncbi:MAG: LysE family transporter [Deltaproteobacteria bacterium]|nr:LysE family transporter [Deltaproteobacteria bacterium]
MGELLVGLVAGLVSSIPMLGPVVLLLFTAGAGRELAAGRALAAGAALSEGAHVTLAALGLGPLLLSEPTVAIGLRLGSGVVLIGLALIAWRAAPPPGDRATRRALPSRPIAAFGLGALLVLPNPGFLVVWVAIVAWLGGGAEAGLASPGLGFVAGAVLGVALWFWAVLVMSARWGPVVIERHGRLVRRAVALALAGFGLWAALGALGG